MSAIDEFSQRERIVIAEALGLASMLSDSTLFTDKEWMTMARGLSLISGLSMNNRADVIRELR